jgi:hypothetical protein
MFGNNDIKKLPKKSCLVPRVSSRVFHSIKPPISVAQIT